MIAYLPGVLAGFSLIIAIGAQNAFVIKQGLLRQHIFIVVSICAISDALLIAIGTAGFGRAIESAPDILEILRWFGVLYLTWFGVKALKSMRRNQSLVSKEDAQISRTRVVATAIALTFLNPHVYLDTVILLGAIGNQFDNDKWYFASGAMTSSLIWFTTIGYGSKFASRYMSKPLFWKILDGLIATIMFSIALTLALYKF